MTAGGRPSSSGVVDDGDADQFYRQAESLIPAEVRMISGCHSEQTSADLSNVRSVASSLPDPAGRAGGACTSALLDILYDEHSRSAKSKRRGLSFRRKGGGNQQGGLTFQDLLLRLRRSLSDSGFEQIPQLTSSRPLELKETPFELVGNGNGSGSGGSRRAVLVGINYRGQSGELTGCINDVVNVKKYIKEVHGFPERDIKVLVDDGGRNLYPTRQRIIAALRDVVAKSVSGDSVYFHYSGHGGLLSPDFNPFKSQTKEYDETLYPLDHTASGHIRDFSLFNHFVKPMKRGVTVTCVMDCCHSGSVLDLPYSFRPTDKGTIRSMRSMDQLSNLAFLYVLAGGFLHPGTFGPVVEHLEETVDGDLDGYQGTGIESAAEDGEYAGGGGDFDDYGNAPDYGGGDDDDDAGEVAEDYGTSDGVPADEDGNVVVAGEAVNPDDVDGTDHVVQGHALPPDDEGTGWFGGDRGFDDGGGGDGGTYEGAQGGDVVRGYALPDDGTGDAAGFGEARGYGDGDDDDGGCGDAGCGDGGDDDAGLDCGCVADVLGALLEED